LIEKNTINIRTSTDDTKRVTLVVTITADGMVLQSVLVFEGQSNGPIVKRGFATHPTTNKYCCQPNAWMDKEVMMVWADEVLAPYMATTSLSFSFSLTATYAT
jgi:hypothetical protein